MLYWYRGNVITRDVKIMYLVIMTLIYMFFVQLLIQDVQNT